MVKIEAVVLVLLAAALGARGTAIPLADDDGISAEAYSEEIRKQLDNPQEQTSRNSRDADPGTQQLDQARHKALCGGECPINPRIF